MRTERRQHFAFTELEPATHAEQDVGFSSERERSCFLEDLEGDVLGDVLLHQRLVREEDRDDLAFATQALERGLAKRILPARELGSAARFVTPERRIGDGNDGGEHFCRAFFEREAAEHEEIVGTQEADEDACCTIADVGCEDTADGLWW